MDTPPSPQTHTLDRIEIEGFKSIRSAQLDLGRLNVLIGANGAGKSNVIEVFRLLMQMVDGRLQAAVVRAGGAARLLHHGPKRTNAIHVWLTIAGFGYKVRLAFTQDDSLFVDHESFTEESPAPGMFVGVTTMATGGRETALGDLAKQDARTNTVLAARAVFAALHSWRVYHFHDTSAASAMRRKGSIDDNDELRSDASNLAAFLYRLQETKPDSFRRIVGAIRQVAPFFADFQLQPDRLNPAEIKLEWSERDSDNYFDATALSDGTLRFICLATLLLQPELPSLILIDEPELGLHPYAVTQLAALLDSAATSTQILVATQSVTLMNQFTPEDVVVVDRIDGGSTFRRISAAEIASWTDSYALGELWEKNIIGGRPQR